MGSVSGMTRNLFSLFTMATALSVYVDPCIPRPHGKKDEFCSVARSDPAARQNAEVHFAQKRSGVAVGIVRGAVRCMESVPPTVSSSQSMRASSVRKDIRVA